MYTGHGLADIYAYAQFSIGTWFPLASRKLQCMLKLTLLIWSDSGTACLRALINNCACAKKISLTALSLVRPHICTDPPMEKETFWSCCWTKSPSAGKLPRSCCWADHQVLACHWRLLLRLPAAHTAKMYRTADSPFLPSLNSRQLSPWWVCRITADLATGQHGAS